MYRMKNIVPFDCEIILPQCMYSLKKNEPLIIEDTQINISDQVNTFLKTSPATKMIELEDRQDLLLKKLDVLYDRIKTISSYCQLNNTSTESIRPKVEKKGKPLTNMALEETVIVLSPDRLPWFLNIYLKKVKDLNISWHIHSSVPTEKKTKIHTFFKKFSELYPDVSSKVNIRLIFKPITADAELKLSSLEIPIVGTVNVIRYVAMTYPTIVKYDFKNYEVDALLDQCFLLERSPEKNRDALVHRLFTQLDTWIYNKQFSIIDLVVYNIVKQWQKNSKYVPKIWFENCEKLIT